jgi:hypothetical protein
MHIWYLSSRWSISKFQVSPLTFVAPWRQSLYPGIEAIDVMVFVGASWKRTPMSTSVASCLPACHKLLKGSEEMESLDVPKRRVTRYRVMARRLWTTLPAKPISLSLISICNEPRLERDWQQTPTCSKLTLTFLQWDKSPSATVGQTLNVCGENTLVWFTPCAT